MYSYPSKKLLKKQWLMVLFNNARIHKRYILVLLLIMIAGSFTNYSTSSYRKNKLSFSSTTNHSHSNCFKMKPSNELNLCVPSILVAGYEKCGTSALYHMLQRHPSIRGHQKNKENCPTGGDSEDSFLSWLQHPDMIKVNDNEKKDIDHVINGCLGIHMFPSILHLTNEKVENLKILILVRDISEFVYSYYNYRCYEGYDNDCSNLTKVSSAGPWKDSRSPKNFLKLIQDIANGKMFQAFSFIQPNMRLYRTLLDPIYSIVRVDQVLVMKQEDLRDRPEVSLRKISTFLDIDYSGFSDDVFNIRSNTRNNPNQIIEHEKEQEITSDVPDCARELLYSLWNQECNYLNDNFDITYKDCD